MGGTNPDAISAYVWRISAVVIIGSIMSILDTTIVNVALATLSRELHASISEIQWVVTAYMLALAAVIPVSGWAARRFGAKQVYIVSLVLFTAGSALCGLATDTTQLTVLRALRVPNPLLDVRLYRRPTFASASFAMFCLGAALFGGMILLPLYWQDVRFESVVATGLLTAPQGLGAAFAMPIAGKLTDRM